MQSDARTGPSRASGLEELKEHWLIELDSGWSLQYQLISPRGAVTAAAEALSHLPVETLVIQILIKQPVFVQETLEWVILKRLF